MRGKLILGTVLFLLLLVMALVAGSSLAQKGDVEPIVNQASPAACCAITIATYLDQAITTTHFGVHYTLTNTRSGANDELDSHAEAQEVSNQLEHVWNLYVNDPDYSFLAPADTTTQPLPVYVFDYENQGCGCYGVPYMKLDAKHISANYPAELREIRQLTAHELFHRVQYSYDKPPEPKWSYEGTASTMQDKAYADVDSWLGSSYLTRTNNYLARPNRGWWYGSGKRPYHAQLFWTYYMQRCGTVNDETALGMDALRIFWEQTLAYDGIDALDHAIQAASGCPRLNSMEELFHDFAVALYVKQMRNVTPRYQFADEHGPLGTTYDDVGIEYGPETLSPSSPISHSAESLQRWGILYYVGQPTAACDWVRVNLDGNWWQRYRYSILTVDSRNAFHYDDPHFRHYGDDLVRTLQSDGLDEVVAIAVGDDTARDFNVSMECVDPELSILSPLPHPGRPAMAGDPLDPRRFLVRLSVSADGYPIDGLHPLNFDVQVGGRPATIVSGIYVQNQYWLVVDPPTQTVTTGEEPWLFNLEVSIGDLSADEDDVVQYDEEPNYDKVLVIDTSNSMAEPAGESKLQAAKNAAWLFIDELDEEDNMGLIKFNTTSSSLLDGMHVASDTNRALAKGLISNTLIATGCTTIGGGLTHALADLNHPTRPGDDDKTDSIVLLSDGLENTNPCWEHSPGECGGNRCMTPFVRQIVIDSGVPVHTVALGPGRHEDLMQRIAQDTTGDYWFAPVMTSSLNSAAEPQQAIDNWMLGLSDVYDYLQGEIEGRSRILEEQRSASTVGPHSTEVPLDASVTRATFAIVLDEAASICDPKVWLETPSGSTLYPGLPMPADVVYREDITHHVFEVPNPEPGTWLVQVGFTNPSPPAPPWQYAVMVSVESLKDVELYIGTAVPSRVAGTRIPILAAYFGGSGLLSGATMTAVVYGNGTQVNLPLYDDGGHDDGAADDGIYGAYFTQATAEGSYIVQLEGVKGQATRRARASFRVEADADDDGDGLPDGYERRNGLDPSRDDSGEDPDRDHLTTAEEYDLGTHPLAADTDHGGESDSSELAAGRDPINNPDDDRLVTPTGVRAVAGNGEVTLRYDARANYRKVFAYWSTDPSLPEWPGQRIDLGNSGEYVHTGLDNDTTYYYLLTARDKKGNDSGYADPISVTPRLDPYEPGGMIMINDGEQKTPSRDVVLTIRAWDDVLESDGLGGPNQNPPPEMRVSNRPDFGGASWESFKLSKDWRLKAAWGEYTYVYVQFRDAAGNLSWVEDDHILLMPSIYLPLILKNK